MKNISEFLSENFQFFVVKFSIYLNRRVFEMLMMCQKTAGWQTVNKKSAESDVGPAGIKSYKFLFVLKKNLFCSIQEIDGLEKWTK